MKILVSESVDKLTRQYIDVSSEILIRIIETDNGLHEVIDMSDSNNNIRLFFDIDWKGEYVAKNEILNNVLLQLNSYYGTEIDDWAITDGSYDDIVSYHIYSIKYYTSLKQIREDVKYIDCKYIDSAVYYFSFNYNRDEGSLRLPNQSKKSINKIAGIHTLIFGELKDCLVTDISHLVKFTY